MGRQRVLRLTAVVSVLAAMPSTAHANMGIPFLAPPIAEMLLLFVPVVALEVWIVKRLLATSYGRTVLVVFIGNLVTTAIGFAAASHDIARHTLPPREWMQYWTYPVSRLANLVPLFFMSWLVEYLVARPLMREVQPSALRRAVLRANLASYGLLVIVVIVIAFRLL